MIGLTKIVNWVLDELEAKTMEQVAGKLKVVVFSCDEAVYNSYKNLVDGDFTTDYLQALYQYYLADREGLKQDFTPKSLSKLLAALTRDNNSIIDLCSGTGALLIQQWVENPDRNFTAVEKDPEVIPFLLFNLCVRGMNAKVIHGDVLSGEMKQVYEVKKDEEFSICRQQ